VTTKDYLGGIEYNNGTVEAVYHEEGRATPQGTTWQYEYSLKDHLGNTRVIFTDANEDGTPEIIQEADYYPFGMRHDKVTTATNHYLYNGKELNEDLGLDWYDYGARFYDGELGRFPSADPLADSYYEWSPYNYVLGNPISFIDPDGRTVEPAKSLKGKKRKIFKSLRANNNVYNELVRRYDVGWQSEVLHYRVGEAGRDSERDPAFAHTDPPEDGFVTMFSNGRGHEALLEGTVNTNFVSENTTGMNDVGIAATLIHEAVHAYILGQYDFDTVSSKDHHERYSHRIFNSTLDGLIEYNTDAGGSFKKRELMLLAAQGLWGTEAVNDAFGLNPSSDDYNEKLEQLKAESKALFFDNEKND